MSRKLRSTAAVAAVTLFAGVLSIVAAPPAAAAQPVVTAIPSPSHVDDLGRGGFKLEVENATPNGVVTVSATALNAPATCDPDVFEDPTLINNPATETADDQGRVAFAIVYNDCSASNAIQVNVTDNVSGLTTTLVVELNDLSPSTAGPNISLTPTGEGISGQEDQVAGQILLTGWAPGAVVNITVNEGGGTCTDVGIAPANTTGVPTTDAIPPVPITVDAEGNGVVAFFGDGCQPNSTLVFTASDGTRSDTATFNVLPRGTDTPGTGTEVCGDGIDNDGDGLIDEGCPTGGTEICGDGIDNDGDGLVDEGCPVADPGSISGTVSNPPGSPICVFLGGFLSFLPGGVAFCATAPASGITVTATGPETGSDTTDASGNYSITGLQTGTYTVTADCPGTGTDPSTTVTLTAGDPTAENVDLSCPGASGGFGGFLGFGGGFDLSAIFGPILIG